MGRKLKAVRAGDNGGLVASEQIDPGDPVVLECVVEQHTQHQLANGTELELSPDPAGLQDAVEELYEQKPVEPFAIPANPFRLPPEQPGYARRHIEAQLSAKQGKTLARLLHGLDDAGARLESGKRVQTAADAVRWLMEWLERE